MLLARMSVAIRQPEPAPRRAVLRLQAIDELRDARDVVDVAHALARAPDILPRLRAFVAGAVLPRLFGGRQVVRVEAGRPDAAGKVAAVHAGEERRVDDVAGARLDDHLLVAL